MDANRGKKRGPIEMKRKRFLRGWTFSTCKECLEHGDRCCFCQETKESQKITEREGREKKGKKGERERKENVCTLCTMLRRPKKERRKEKRPS